MLYSDAGSAPHTTAVFGGMIAPQESDADVGRPTVESKTTTLYWRSRLMSENGFTASETPAGAARPGELPAPVGSQMSTSKQFCSPRYWTSASWSTTFSWRNWPEPVRALTSTL